MDRATRKANLKKLQLPSASGYKQRKTRQTAKTKATATNTAITNYFLTPEKHNNHAEEINNGVNKLLPTVSELKHNKAQQSSDLNTVARKPKRTKLDAFIFKDPNNMPNSIKKLRKSLNDEDFVLPEKNAKKAPKLSQIKSSKSQRAKKQTTIKSAFLRNEQLFAEIAAQHCAADQFDGDDVQLALAISESESKGTKIIEENIINDGNGLLDGANEAESIREKLKKYGFRTAEMKDYNTFAAAFLPKFNNRRPKSKWNNKFTALTLRSSENQMKKLQAHIEKLLNSQFRTKPLSDHEKLVPQYKLQSSLLKKSGVHESKRILQTAENRNQSNEWYFVGELFEINQLPADYLLKDWTAIQGRDLTPNQKNKKNDIEKLKALETIYQDLEEFFSTRKRLHSTEDGDNKEDQAISKNKKISESNEVREMEMSAVVVNCGLNPAEMVENAKHRNEECGNENVETNLSDSAYDNKILQLLPTIKSLDTMQVSSCSINTQATINATQKNRSNSPDLFADSDVEMEETHKADQYDDTQGAVINVTNDKSKTNSLDRMAADVITYEIFSSDEVKNITLLELTKPALKESSPNSSHHTSNIKVIDLTQDDFQLSTNNNSTCHSNQSKPIEEIDLFAYSPLPEEEEKDTNSADINSNSQHSIYFKENEEDVFKFTLSMDPSDKDRQIIEKKMKKSLKLSLSPNTQEQLDMFTIYQNDDIVLREIAMDQSNTSFLNFQGSKQLETSFHQKTATVENDIIKDNLKDNDTLFRKLCNKYLSQEPVNRSTISTVFSKSFSQSLPIKKTPQKRDNATKFTMDFNMTDDKNVTLKRKSLSFTAKTPLKYETKDSKTFLSNSQYLNKHHSNVSIDLTQNDAEDEYDDCLVLSDDEINYSIWQANKSLKFQTSMKSNHQEDIVYLSDSENSSDEENIVEFPGQHEDKKFSYLDLEKSLIKITLRPEQSISDFGILTSKYSISNSPAQDELKFDRSEFGILEEYSEPIDYTPNLCTPTKVLTELPFLSSPTETAIPMKRFSNCQRSSQKFQDLINNIEAKSPPHAVDDFSDFDEFDRLLYTSPLKSIKSNKNPQGIDQLLTAEISFKESQKLPETTKNGLSESFEKSTQEIKCNNKIYTVRYTSSPKPDYTKYTEAELLKELYNFGIKPLTRKHAVKMLEYIYNQTHPILMEEDEDLVEQQPDVIRLDDFERPCTSKESLKAKTLLTTSHENFTTTNESETEGSINLLDVANKKLNLQDACGQEMLRYSVHLKAELSDENYILQTNVSKKTPQPLLPFHIAWYNLVCSNRKLHENILTYEPIDLQEVYLFLKKLGHRYDPKELKLFFDRRCIIFRYDFGSVADINNKIKATNRHVCKSKKSKVAKN